MPWSLLSHGTFSLSQVRVFTAVPADRLASVCQALFTCRQMDDSDCTVCGVDMLTSSSTRSLSLDPQVLWVYCERDLKETYKHYMYLNLH